MTCRLHSSGSLILGGSEATDAGKGEQDMNTEKQDVYTRITNRIIADLEQGISAADKLDQ